MDGLGFPIVIRDGAVCFVKRQRMGVVLADEHDIELACFQHALEGAFSLTNGDGLAGIVIADVDGATTMRLFSFWGKVSSLVACTRMIPSSITWRRTTRASPSSG